MADFTKTYERMYKLVDVVDNQIADHDYIVLLRWLDTTMGISDTQAETVIDWFEAWLWTVNE